MPTPDFSNAIKILEDKKSQLEALVEETPSDSLYSNYQHIMNNAEELQMVVATINFLSNYNAKGSLPKTLE